MHKYSISEVQTIIDDLNSPLAGLVHRGQKVAILYAVARESGWAESDMVRAYAAEVLMRFPLQKPSATSCAGVYIVPAP